MLDQRNDVGLLKGREDYYTSGRPDGSNSLSGIKGINYGKGTYVFLSSNEGIDYSKTGGRTWTVVPLPDASTYWYKLIYTGDNHFGGRFVAVGGSAGKQGLCGLMMALPGILLLHCLQMDLILTWILIQFLVVL